MWPWEQEPRSIASGILDDETYDWLPIAWGIIESGGHTPVVSDKQISNALKLARKHTVIPAGPTGVSGLAGLTKTARIPAHNQRRRVFHRCDLSRHSAGI